MEKIIFHFLALKPSRFLLMLMKCALYVRSIVISHLTELLG